MNKTNNPPGLRRTAEGTKEGGAGGETNITIQRDGTGYRATVRRGTWPLYVTVTTKTEQEARLEARKFTDLLKPQPRRQGRRFWEYKVTASQRDKARRTSYAKKCGPIIEIDPTEYSGTTKTK